jgi:outer membrane protein OmpA-like peptidoglycan-associated protein
MCVTLGNAQMATLEGYIYESNNRGFLNLVKVTITENGGDFKTKAITDKDGFFTCELPQGKEYTLVALKDVFEYKEVTISTKEGKPKVYAKIEMVREPGYLFEVTMAEKYVEGKESVDAITDALIEIYNNTADTSVLVLAHHPSHTFNYTFEQGNHYTVMIRKEGYFTKRLEAFVNVDGCIMCFEGIDEIQPGQPGIADNLTAGHHMGVLVANVELEEIRMGEAIKIENIYYDLAKSEIRKDAYKPLDNLIHVLKNNPSLMVELGSHTDSQGDDQSNFKLSSDRAQAAVDYILDNSNIRKGRIQARGYGETDLVNGCKNGIKCSDRKHQQNRRTELKIVGIADYDPFADKSLVDIIREEKFEETLAEIQNQEIVQFEDGEIPDEIRAQLEGGDPSKSNAAEQPLSSSNRDGANKNTQQGSMAQTIPSGKSNGANNPTTRSTKPPMTSTQSRVPSTNLAVGENEPEMDLNIDTGRTRSSAGTSKVEVGEFEITGSKEYAAPQVVPNGYTGFVVEFFRSSSSLPASHTIFRTHGSVKTDTLGDGSISYMLGDFKNKMDAEKFLKYIVSPQYKNAKVIAYNKGSRS